MVSVVMNYRFRTKIYFIVRSLDIVAKFFEFKRELIYRGVYNILSVYISVNKISFMSLATVLTKYMNYIFIACPLLFVAI